MNKESIAAFFQELQNEIITGLETLDGKETFRRDPWERAGGGGGISTIIENGAHFEKGGVNFSAVHGPTPEAILKGFGMTEGDFFATGISIVIHPMNPWVPIIHMNTRYFELSTGLSWFGGGIDVTPHYVIEDQAKAFHRGLKSVCDQAADTYYDKYKKWADDYFFIKHRDESRGIGGIFFDQLGREDDDIKMLDHWEFVKSVGKSFIPLYTALVNPNKDLAYGENHQEWQRIRRSRYVEFNLVWDRGTKFGLDTNGRTESILMSLPPMASWHYDYQTAPGSPEAQTQSLLKKGIDWV